MSTPSSAFRSSNRSSMGSNTYTTQQQGGGAKKAGFPYQVGRNSWASINFNTCDAKNGAGVPADQVQQMRCGGLKCMQFTGKPLTNQSRPTGSTSASNRYFHVV